MDAGRAVETGNHAALLAQDGLYRRLVATYEATVQIVIEPIRIRMQSACHACPPAQADRPPSAGGFSPACC